jgi:hypothetical protein
VIDFLTVNLWWIAGLAVIAAAILAPAALWRLRWPTALVIAIAFAHVFWLDASAAHLELAQRDAHDATAGQQASEGARQVEHQAGAQVAAIDTTHHEDIDPVQADVDAVRAGRSDGTLQLRPQFKCPATRADVPGPSAGAGGGDEASAAQLSRADEDILVRFAGDADLVRAQLKAAQDTISVYQATCGAKAP